MSKFVRIFFFAFFFVPGITTAQVVISEIMYDLEGSDTGREWVEVFNSGSSAILLTEWKLFEADSNHNIAAHSGGESLVSGAYAIIADNPAKFLEDRPAYTGLLFDSAFSLSNTGETLALRCCSTGEGLIDKDSISYDPGIGAAGDGNTLNRASAGSSSFAAGTPTPGMGNLQKTGGNSNSAPASDSDDAAAEASGSTASSAGTASSNSVLARASAGNNRAVIAGIETQLEASAYDGSNRPVEAEFRWNFGDGATALGRTVSHKWEYAGRYAVVLEAVRYGEKASHRITVSVEFPELSFKALPDGGVIIENLSNRELDLSGWRIAERGMTFVFPQNTVVLRGASIRLSSTNIGFFASAAVTLLYPNGTAFSAGTPDVTEEVALTPTSDETTFVDTSAIEPTTLEDTLEPDSESIEDAGEDIVQEKTEEETPPLQDQTAQRSEQLAAAGAAGAGSNMPLLWWLGAVLLLALAGVAVYAARRHKRRGWTIIEDMSE